MSFRSAMARGFTLIEMAIVLVVVGLILSGGILAVGPILENTKTTETRARLELIEKAILIYTIQNGCLPCPANGAAGTAAGPALPATCGACTVATLADRVVPWTTLGLSRNDATDGWGNLISYVVDPDLTLTATSMVRTTSATDPYPNDDPGEGLYVVDADDGTELTSRAGYILISHGRDGFGARTTNGTAYAAAPAGNTSQLGNAAKACTLAGTPCYQGDRIDLNGNTMFDDIVLWRTPALIIQQCGDNACGNPA